MFGWQKWYTDVDLHIYLSVLLIQTGITCRRKLKRNVMLSCCWPKPRSSWHARSSSSPSLYFCFLVCKHFHCIKTVWLWFWSCLRLCCIKIVRQCDCVQLSCLWPSPVTPPSPRRKQNKKGNKIGPPNLGTMKSKAPKLWYSSFYASQLAIIPQVLTFRSRCSLLVTSLCLLQWNQLTTYFS